MHRQTVWYITASQYTLFFFLLVCIILNPHFLLTLHEGGISNYGLYAVTVIPYSLALGGCGLLLYRAAWHISTRSKFETRLKRCLKIIGVLYGLVLLSTYPYKLNLFLDRLHIACGIVLFLGELFTGCLLIYHESQNLKRIFIFAVQLVGFGICVLSLLPILHLLFIAQLIFSSAFGILLIISTQRLQKQVIHKSS